MELKAEDEQDNKTTAFSGSSANPSTQATHDMRKIEHRAQMKLQKRATPGKTERESERAEGQAAEFGQNSHNVMFSSGKQRYLELFA